MLIATCDFQSSTLGNVAKGDQIPEGEHGRDLLSVGLAERVRDTKTVERKPGEDYLTKVVENKPGSRQTKTKGKKRGRKRSNAAAS